MTRYNTCFAYKIRELRGFNQWVQGSHRLLCNLSGPSQIINLLPLWLQTCQRATLLRVAPCKSTIFFQTWSCSKFFILLNSNHGCRRLLCNISVHNKLNIACSKVKKFTHLRSEFFM